ncbi:Gypsy retrotransposon integrase-like protein [Arachis hypogaea]|nr:Gypsy retrotransposon integrase-like protein [Arachis hypogaea]
MCLRPDQTDYVLSEVHEGCCGHHIGGKALARKLVPSNGVNSMLASRPFTQWGVDLLGPFPVGLESQKSSSRTTGRSSWTRSLQKFSSVEHPQSNGQVEAANKVIIHDLKKRLDQKKSSWAGELALVLWSYRMTPQSSTRETPFRLIYGVDAVILVEIGEPSPRMLLVGVEEAIGKDLIDETRGMPPFD